MGNDIRNNKEYKENIILISDDFLTEGLKTEKLNKIMKWIEILLPKFNKKRFDELIKLFDIDMKLKYNKLSFGKQSLFRNIIGISSGMDIILLDEPTTGLDEVNRDLFYKKLLEYQEVDGTTIMVSSHILGDIEKIATDIIMLHDTDVIINEPIDDIEDKSYIFTIDLSDLDLLANKHILKKSSIGNQAVLYVYDSFTNEEMKVLSQKATVNRMSLADLFKAINEGD